MARRARRGTGRAGVTAAAGLASLVTMALLQHACATVPPSDPDDVCAMFDQRPEWREAADAAVERWDVSAATILAFIHQESRFRPAARPGWKRLLGVVPVGRRSSAYGYGQVKDGTWDDYRDRNDRPHARRDRFTDVVDFVGWYGDVIHRITGVEKSDTFHLYLAYHEGPNGYRRRTFDAKPWLLGVARKVDDRAQEYAAQHATCGGPAVASR